MVINRMLNLNPSVAVYHWATPCPIADASVRRLLRILATVPHAAPATVPRGAPASVTHAAPATVLLGPW